MPWMADSKGVKKLKKSAHDPAAGPEGFDLVSTPSLAKGQMGGRPHHL
jgi:hypothetical protein